MGVVDLARVLVIDDDVSFRTAVCTALTMDVHDVEEAADGLDGIERFNQHPTDLVITDMVMPGNGENHPKNSTDVPGREDHRNFGKRYGRVSQIRRTWRRPQD